MGQKWYKKATVQSVIIAGGFGLIVAAMPFFFVSKIEQARERSYKEGFEAGKAIGDRYNLLKFMDLYKEKLIEMSAVIPLISETQNMSKEELMRRYGDPEQAKLQSEIRKVGVKRQFGINARALVDFVKDCRAIQEEFNQLLNGRIDELEAAIQNNDYQKMQETILILQKKYDGTRLAIQTIIAKEKPALSSKYIRERLKPSKELSNRIDSLGTKIDSLQKRIDETLKKSMESLIKK